MPAMNRPTFNLLAIAGTCAALSGCWCNQTARVVVINRDSGEPVPGAVVRAKHTDCFGNPNYSGRAVRTNRLGRATIRDDAMDYRGFTVEARGYEQYLPPGWFYSEGSYPGVLSPDGTHILHVIPWPAQ